MPTRSSKAASAACASGVAGAALELGDLRGRPLQLGTHLVDERRPNREIPQGGRDLLLRPRDVRCAGLRVVLLRPPPSGHAPLEPAHATERLERGRGLVRRQLAAIRQEHELGGRRQPLADVVSKARDRAECAGQRGQRGEQVGTAFLDAPADLLFLCEGEQRPFAELTEVHAHEVGVFVGDRARLEHLGGLGNIVARESGSSSSSPGRSSTG